MLTELRQPACIATILDPSGSALDATPQASYMSTSMGLGHSEVIMYEAL